MFEIESSNLPEFDRPPVVETVLAAQFEPIKGMRTVHFGLFWERIRERFPTTEDKPALEAAFERFEEAPKRTPRLRFEAREDATPERMWFVNKPGTEMIQLQVDRFIKNWRKTSVDAEYPRYEKTIKPGFLRDLSVFQEFLLGEGLGPIRMNQCEVTYVNHIVAGEGFTDLGDASKVFSFLGGLPHGVEDGIFALRFPIVVEGKPVGRLKVDIQPAIREADHKPMYVMQLTARGFVGSGLEFFDLGRAAIVKGFDELTTASMHSVWGKKGL